MEDDSKTNIKPITFNGDKGKFTEWQARFMSYAFHKGFDEVLEGTLILIEPPNENDVLTDEEVKSNTNFKKLNSYAYSTLMMVVKDEIGFGAIHNARTETLPKGDAYKAWTNLETIFKPKSSAKKHELEQAFNKSSLDKEQKNPDEWFAELEKIRLQLKIDFATEIPDEQMISQILYNTNPPQYKTAIALIKRDINRNVEITLDAVKDDLRQIYGSLKASAKPNKETALVGKPKFKKQFKGHCRLCGKIGHKAADCWTSESNKNKRPKNYKQGKGNKEVANVTSTNPKKKEECAHCHKPGHNIKDCWKKKAEDAKQGIKPDTNTSTDSSRAAVMMIAVSRNEFEVLLSNTDSNCKMTRNTFICDSGASCHMRNSTEGMYDLIDHTQAITVGNSETMYSSYIGKFQGTIIQQDGTNIDIVLHDVLYVPDLWVNLISVTKALKYPQTKLNSKGELIAIDFVDKDQQTTQTIVFDKIFTTGNGQLLGIEIQPEKEYGHVCLLSKTQLKYEDIHGKLGHPNEQVVKQTVKHYGISIMEPTHNCIYCAAGKHKKTPIPKFSNQKATAIGERVYIDISYTDMESYGGNRYWLLIVDSYTDYIWSFFLRRKSETSETIIGWATSLEKEKNITIKNIRCDNAGENVMLGQMLKSHETLNINVEFTAPNTPQQNGKVERKFQTLYGKIRSMLNWARFPTDMRRRLWAQCAKAATLLENIILKSNSELTSYELFHGKASPHIDFLRTFGEVAMVHDAKKIQGKLKNKGKPCIFIGYPDNHSMEVYEFLTLDNQSLILSRNYIWLDQSYGEYMNLDVVRVPRANLVRNEETDQWELNMDLGTENENDQEEEIPDPEEIEDNQNEDDSDDESNQSDIRTERVRGVNRALRNLETFFNPNPWEHLQDVANETSLTATIYDGNPEPKSVAEAKKTKDWKKWLEAIFTEFDNMEEKEVWEVVNRKDIPSGRKIIGNRWVFAIKDDGRYRARTVAKGYSQVPGEDFQENFAPVILDTSFHIILVLYSMMKMKAGQFDIETAFLYGDLEEAIWMILPDSYVEYYWEKHSKQIDNTTHCLRLKKSLYGLVQAARQWWKKFKESMKEIGFKASDIDPCLFIKEKKNGNKVYLILYVDDGGIFGTEEDVNETIQDLRKTFKVKDLGKLEHFVGCHLVENQNNGFLNIHQPKLLKHLSEAFKDSIMNTKEYKTPAGPKTMVIRPKPGDPLISQDDQSKYRSGVGMLLYLVKHSRPDISNAVRELSKVCDGATECHWKALMRTIKYVLTTQNIGLKIQPKPFNGEYVLEAVSDSEYAGDKDTRVSVYGFVIYFCGAPISWKSKSGRSVTLSSTEAEYFAMSECAKELIFTKNVLESMGIKIKLPIEIKVDNTGAIYLSNNYTTGQRTKHIDVRVHFVRQYIEDGIFKIVFVKSEANDADIFTKNTSEEIFKEQSEKIVEEIENNK